ncbi:MAG: sigma-70 family RNA polymerase sigma factor [Caldisericia bacterium]
MRDKKPVSSMDILEEDVGFIPASNDMEPEDHAVMDENKNRIVKAISNLPMKYRPFVVMKHLHGMSYTEIAEINDVPVTTVRNRIHQGKKILEKLFVEFKVVQPEEGGYELG